MLMERKFIRRVLVTFVVFSGLQNTLKAHGPRFSDECQREVAYCTIRAALQYIGLGTDELFAKARAISLEKHCDEWGKAMQCNRQKLKSEECLNATSADTKTMIKYVEAVDLLVNYACKENFLKFSEIYQCLLDRKIDRSVLNQCKDVKFNATDACEKLPEFIECAAEGVASQCGPEAGSVTRELGPKLFEKIIEVIYDRKCSPSARDDITELVRKFFIRK